MSPRRAQNAKTANTQRGARHVEKDLQRLKKVHVPTSHVRRESGEVAEVVAGGAFATMAAGLMGYWLGTIIGGETGGTVGAAICGIIAFIGFVYLVWSGSKPAQ